MQKTLNSLLLGLFFILCSTGLFAQDSSSSSVKKAKPKFKHQIGVNIASFFDRYLRFNSSTPGTDPNLFTYRHYLSNSSALRLGFSLGMANEDLTSNTSSLPRKSKSNNESLRLGYEYFVLKTFAWRAGVGVQAFAGRSRSTSSSTDSVQGTTFSSTSSYFSFGAGPLVSIQYYIARRVSLGTEASINCYHSQSKDITKVTGNFTQESKNESKVTAISITPPISFYINFNF